MYVSTVHHMSVMCAILLASKEHPTEVGNTHQLFLSGSPHVTVEGGKYPEDPTERSADFLQKERTLFRQKRLRQEIMHQRHNIFNRTQNHV